MNWQRVHLAVLTVLLLGALAAMACAKNVDADHGVRPGGRRGVVVPAGDPALTIDKA